MSQETLYHRLEEQKKVIKTAHCLTLMNLSIVFTWNADRTTIANNADGGFDLTISKDIMEALNIYNTEKKLGNEFKNVHNMLHRVLIAINSQMTDLNEASKIQVSEWFAFRYSDVGEYYEFLKGTYNNKRSKNA